MNQINIGEKASFQKTITETDVYLFAGISGDYNPAHINEIEAINSTFKGRIAHGMLTASLISAVLGMQLPGPGTIYLAQELNFISPVKLGDTITAEVEIASKDTKRNQIIVNTVCYNQLGKMVITGIARVMPPR